MTNNKNILSKLWNFLKVRKKWWLLPIVIATILLLILLIWGDSVAIDYSKSLF